MRFIGPKRLLARARLPTTILVMAVGFGCIKVTTVNIGQKTSLERQLIGEFEPLTEEEVLAASVRAGAGSGSVTLDDLKQQAVAARRRQLFNRDDLDELKGFGCLGEAAGAELAAHECEPTQENGEGKELVQTRVERLVNEENEDRRVIINWALEADPVLTSADRDQVVEVYARLLRERLEPGHWYRGEDGAWSQTAATAD